VQTIFFKYSLRRGCKLNLYFCEVVIFVLENEKCLSCEVKLAAELLFLSEADKILFIEQAEETIYAATNHGEIISTIMSL